MNTSFNHADFIGMCLDSDEDYEPYGYAMEQLQALPDRTVEHQDRSIECILFAPNPGYLFHD